MSSKIPSPKEFFGFTPGDDRKMIRWDRLTEYYRLLDSLSDRMYLEKMGPTSEGNDFYHIVISSEDNLKNLDTYLDIAKRLADPEGLSEAEINILAKKGKAICMQSYGLHSNEVGGPQMCPNLVYDLITAQDGELYDILQNVIFVMVPCAEPDGEIIFTDFYHKYLGTDCEGRCSPYIRHRWAGHSNNRDAVHETVIESKYLNDLMLRRYYPQVYQDHHHQCPHEDRMCIAPVGGLIPASVSPLTYRETSLYGASMAADLDAAGRRGVVSGSKNFAGFPITTFHNMGLQHNIASMLSETADVMIATPVFVSEDQRLGHRNNTLDILCPSPWEGGWWHLRDIVTNMYIASRSLLSTMATNKERVLKNMAKKAQYQIQRGAASKQQAYIIPAAQHDAGATNRLLSILEKHGVKMLKATEDFVSDGHFCTAGSIIVPLAQPKLGFITAMLSFDANPTHSKDEGSCFNNDGFFTCFSLIMGVDVFPANSALTVNNEEYHFADNACDELPLCGSSNASFAAANRLLRQGKQLYRDDSGTFFGEAAPDRFSVSAARVGLVTLSATNNEEEGFARNILRTFDFPWRDVFDTELKENVPEDIDVLIIPGHTTAALSAGDTVRHPAECTAGLGTKGRENLKKFVERGGRVIALAHSCEYTAKTFDMMMRFDQDPEFNANQSIVKVKLNKDRLTLGMKDEVPVLYAKGSVMNESIWCWGGTSKYEVIATFANAEELVINGVVTHPETLEKTPAVIRKQHGDGEVVLCGFDPKFRIQTDATFKLLFNALYK